MFYTYEIKCHESSKSYYGSTTNFKKRIQQHRYLLCRDRHHSAHLQKAWNKYGADAFEFILLNTFETMELMLDAEKQLLINNYLDSYNVSTEVDKCHMLGRHHSDEAKEKIRLANLNKIISEETKDKIRQARSKQVMTKGRKHSQETIDKIKAKRANQVIKSGWKMSDESKQKMREARLGRKFPRNENK